jgi:hypothetical protein
MLPALRFHINPQLICTFPMMLSHRDIKHIHLSICTPAVP